jgi:uncharacterized membrane protein
MKQLLLLLVLLPSVLGATEILNANTTIDITGKTANIQTSQYISSTEPIGNLILILSKQANNVKVHVDEQKRECELQQEFARCGNLSAGDHKIDFSYTTNYPFANVGENTLFKHAVRLTYPGKKQTITLKLPVGTIIPREVGKDESFYISPDTAEIYSDGERIILIWEEDKQEVDVSVIMKDTTPTPVAWIALAGISTIIAAGSIAYILFHRKPKEKIIKKSVKKTKEKAPVKELLPQFIEDERKVVELLQNAPNHEAWQKTILQETKFSKAKVSRIIRNLEERGVVSKTIYGNTNKVTLKHTENISQEN